jgi:hypothetical protein
MITIRRESLRLHSRLLPSHRRVHLLLLLVIPRRRAIRANQQLVFFDWRQFRFLLHNVHSGTYYKVFVKSKKLDIEPSALVPEYMVVFEADMCRRILHTSGLCFPRAGTRYRRRPNPIRTRPTGASGISDHVIGQGSSSRLVCSARSGVRGHSCGAANSRSCAKVIRHRAGGFRGHDERRCPALRIR